MKRSEPAYIEIYNELYLKIINGEYKDGDRLPTEMELCEKYYVSRITVQRALGLLVDKGNLLRIGGKGSFVKTTAQAADLSCKSQIGVIVSGISPSYGMEMLKSLENHCAAAGYNMVWRNSRYDRALEESILLDFANNKEIKGVILQPVHDECYNSAVLDLSLKKYPLVLVDRNLEGISLPFAGTENASITEKVVSYLFSMGHTNVGFISSNPQNTTTVRDRYAAFNAAFSKQSIVNSYKNHYFDVISVTQGATAANLEKDIDGIEKHILSNPHLTCLFAAEYAICCLVKTVLNRLGKRCPDDISLVTFDNISDPFITHHTSYIHQNEDEMAKRAVELLCKRIAGQALDTKYYISADFIINNSVKRIKK